MTELPVIRDGDTIEFEFQGESLQGIAILDNGVGIGREVILAETESHGIVLPDQRFPVLLLASPEALAERGVTP